MRLAVSWRRRDDGREGNKLRARVKQRKFNLSFLPPPRARFSVIVPHTPRQVQHAPSQCRKGESEMSSEEDFDTMGSDEEGFDVLEDDSMGENGQSSQ